MAIGDWLVKRISALTRTATDADLTDSEYMAVDNASAYTRKITVASLATWIHNKWASFVQACTAITSFASGDTFSVSNPTNGTRKMSKDTLLTLTAQNALAGNVAPTFDPTRDEDHKYIAGECVSHDGKNYIFKVDHYGAWIVADAKNVDFLNGVLKMDLLSVDECKLGVDRGKNLFNIGTYNKLNGAYVGCSTGQVVSVEGTSAYVIPVKAGMTLSFNKGSLNVCALSAVPILPNYSNNNYLPNYIDGVVSSTSSPWSVPDGAACIIVSVADAVANELQIEEGSASTEYEPYKVGLSLDRVFGLSDSLSKKLNVDHSKNLFNKGTLEKKTGVYVGYTTGQVVAATGSTAYVVRIPEGVTQISVNKNSPQVCAFAEVPDLANVRLNKYIPGFLGGSTGVANQGYTLPTGTKCLVCSFSDTLINTLQVEEGASSTSYVPYAEGLQASKIIGADTLHVGAGQQYTTIQSAVDNAPDNATIVVHPGVYNEAVDIASTNKFLKIVGLSKKDCVLTYSSGDYYKPPLEMSKGYVENLTIKATGTSMDPGAIQNAYCVHIDYDNEANSSLQFVNCYFENDIRDCVGIGLRENYTLSFVGCTFVNHNAVTAPIYCHEQQASNKVGQRLELVNCSMYNDYMSGHAYSVTLQESPAYTGNEMSVLMQRCIMKTKNGYSPEGKALAIVKYGSGTGGEGSGGPGYLGSQGWYLDPLSEQNNESICNYSEQ